MANRFLTNNEATLELAIPLLRIMLMKAKAQENQRADGVVTVRNPIRDCVPVQFGPEILADYDGAMAKIDQIEADLRKKVEYASKEQSTTGSDGYR